MSRKCVDFDFKEILIESLLFFCYRKIAKVKKKLKKVEEIKRSKVSH